MILSNPITVKIVPLIIKIIKILLTRPICWSLGDEADRSQTRQRRGGKHSESHWNVWMLNDSKWPRTSVINAFSPQIHPRWQLKDDPAFLKPRQRDLERLKLAAKRWVLELSPYQWMPVLLLEYYIFPGTVPSILTLTDKWFYTLHNCFILALSLLSRMEYAFDI